MSKIDRARVFPAPRGPRGNANVLDGLLPWAGAETAGMPPTERLAALEQEQRFRLAPRRPLWPQLVEFDKRVAELEARDRDALGALEGARELLRDVDKRDADVLARWELDDRSGAKPEPERSELETRVSEVEREREGLRTAIADVLAQRASFVERNRDRLAAVAERLVGEARGRYIGLVEQLAAARAELVDLRATELWARVYPDSAAAVLPPMDQLGLGLRAVYPVGLADRVLHADGVMDLLRRDAEAIASAMTNGQRVVVEGLDPRTAALGDTAWDADRAGTRANRYEQLRQAAAQALELPLERVGDLEIERFARARAAGEV